MTDGPRPAHTRDSTVLRLPGAVSLDDLSRDWAWGGATGTGVRVAIVDSGIEAEHPDLEGCVDEAAGVRITIDANGEVTEEVGPHGDSFGHGTACASVIHGLAPGARITSVKVLGAGLSGKGAAFLRGLSWAVEHGFEVVNLSLGTTKSDWALGLYQACDTAYFRGTFVVTAANNMMSDSFPSMYANVTSVACNLSADPFRFHYNPEPPTEFLARGIDVELAWLGGSRVIVTGNSFAAPHIAGIAALIKSKHPELRPFQLKTVLWATASNVQEAPRPAGRLSQSMQRMRSLRSTGSLRSFAAAGPPDPERTPQ